MARLELERRYKQWCQNAAQSNDKDNNNTVPSDLFNGEKVSIGPLIRNVPTTALVVRTEHGRILPMRSFPSIIRDTAKRIDHNDQPEAASKQKEGEGKREGGLVLTLQELASALADLCSYSDEKNKGLHGLGLHLLPYTLGNWITGLRLTDDPSSSSSSSSVPITTTTEENLSIVFQKLYAHGRFRLISIYASYNGLSPVDTRRKTKAQRILQWKDSDASLMDVLGDDLDDVNIKEEVLDPNLVGMYLCRKSMIKRIEQNADRALGNFTIFAPTSPLDDILATRLYEASRVYGNVNSKSRYPIRRYAGKSGSGTPILREIPGLLGRVHAIVRENHGMVQITTLLVRLVETLLHVESGQRDGAKERGMLHNLRHATAVHPANNLVFFLNGTRTEHEPTQKISLFAPPVLSEFDLQETSSGDSTPSWAKSLLDLEQMTGHDTTDDMRGSSTVTMVGFPFQCTFVLENEPGQPFFYCPHRFANRRDAIDHVKAVHRGDDLTEESILKIAQVDDQLADTEFGKLLQPINELAKVRQLGLDERDPEKLRKRATLHADLYEISRVITQNTRLLARLQQDRDEGIKLLQSLDRSTEGGAAAVKRQRQLFAARNREITELKKHMLSPATLVRFQSVWIQAKMRKGYITKNMYGEFVQAKNQLLWLDRTMGEEARRYQEQVVEMGGVDPGAVPAGVPGGGIRVHRSNIGGMLTQDWIEQSRYIEAVQDANEALIATKRKANFQRVVSDYDQDFGASNVLPAATPVLAANGWEQDSEEPEEKEEEGEEEEEAEEEEMETEKENGKEREKETTFNSNSSFPGPSSPSPSPSPMRSTSSPRPSPGPGPGPGPDTSNPLKRSRPKDERSKDSSADERPRTNIKIRALVPTVPTFLRDVLDVELQRIFRVCGLNEVEKNAALPEAKRTLARAFDPQIHEIVMSMPLKNALNGEQIRTLMDPFRDKVSILVLTDPRLIRYPTGVLRNTLSACVALIDRVHKNILDDDALLCLVLASGICTLLQSRFRLSRAGFQVVVEALRRVFLERIEGGRAEHWNVVTLLVETLNGNLKGFWNAALLQRYHAIQDPSYKPRYVDNDPERTYAPSSQLPSIETVAARIRKPMISDTSVLSVWPRESTSKFPKLRIDEAKTLIDQVTSVVAGHDAAIVRIADTEGLDAKTWIQRLVRGNDNASDNPHALCTWFREKKVTLAECMDEEKHQWLRQARCCICSDLLGSAPIQGWCCLSGASSLEAVLDRALQNEEIDSTRCVARRDTLRQIVVNKIISQPQYPSFHFWHRHCKQADDHRRLIEAFTMATKPPTFVALDECPLCRTQYPRDESSLPSLAKMSQQIEQMDRTISRLASSAKALRSPSPSLSPLSLSLSPSTPESLPPPLPISENEREEENEEEEEEEEGGEDYENDHEGDEITDIGQSRTVDMVRTGMAYVGTLFQRDSGCQASPAALFPPSPAPILSFSDNGLTLYDDLVHDHPFLSEDVDEREQIEVERALEATRLTDAVSTSSAPHPLDIKAMNELMDELDSLMENEEMNGNANANANAEGSDFDLEGLLLPLLQNEDNALRENIEASARDRDVTDVTLPFPDIDDGDDDDDGGGDVFGWNSREPVEPVGSFGAKFMGGSGACLKKCPACPYMMPRTNQIGPYRLTTAIDCTTRNVVYLSICHTCGSLHGIGAAVGSLSEEVRLLQEMSQNRSTMLSRCSLNHVPTLIGLEQFTDETDAMAKVIAWKEKFAAMINIEAVAI